MHSAWQIFHKLRLEKRRTSSHLTALFPLSYQPSVAVLPLVSEFVYVPIQQVQYIRLALSRYLQQSSA